MQLVVRFMKSIYSMKAPWPLWVAMLMALNMMGTLFFIHTLEAKAVLALTMAGSMFMMLLFSGYGSGAGAYFLGSAGDLARAPHTRNKSRYSLRNLGSFGAGVQHPFSGHGYSRCFALLHG